MYKKIESKLELVEQNEQLTATLEQTFMVTAVKKSKEENPNSEL